MCPTQRAHFVTRQHGLGGLGSGANREERPQKRLTFQMTHTGPRPRHRSAGQDARRQRTPACRVSTITCPKVHLGRSRFAPLLPLDNCVGAHGARQVELRSLGASANCDAALHLRCSGYDVRDGHSPMTSSDRGAGPPYFDQRQGDQSSYITWTHARAIPTSPLACSPHRLAHPTQNPAWTHLRGISARSAILERGTSHQDRRINQAARRYTTCRSREAHIRSTDIR